MTDRLPDQATDAGEGPSPASINAADTRHAAFLGRIPAEMLRPRALLRTPVLVRSLTDFKQQFIVDAVPDNPAPEHAGHLINAVAGYFANGGKTLWVVVLEAAAESLSGVDVALLDDIEPVSQIAAPGYCDADSHAALIRHCESHLARLAVLDAPEQPSRWEALAEPVSQGGLRPEHVALGRAALYAPWLQVEDAVTGQPVWTPPSGLVCGAIARNDTERGPHKAPGNLPLHAVTGLRHTFNDHDQSLLNPAGVNLIRDIHGGIRIWGARSLAPVGSEWQLLPVRRLADMILYSVRVGLRWTATEYHDAIMRGQIRGQVQQFLSRLHERGYLAGHSPERAFFVRCDEGNNGTDELLGNRVHLEIGMAAMRSGEFNLLELELPTRTRDAAGRGQPDADVSASAAHHGAAGHFRTAFVSDQDRAEWQRLFSGYAAFYDMELDAATLDRVWSWLLDPAHVLEGLITHDGRNRAVGMAHVRACPRPLGGHAIGFLDDLFVLPEARGEGAAEALFAALQQLAADRDWPALRWITRASNHRARAFYDHYTGGPTEFLLYHWDPSPNADT